jgi:hypothetical protein
VRFGFLEREGRLIFDSKKTRKKTKKKQKKQPFFFFFFSPSLSPNNEIKPMGAEKKDSMKDASAALGAATGRSIGPPGLFGRPTLPSSLSLSVVLVAVVAVLQLAVPGAEGAAYLALGRAHSCIALPPTFACWGADPYGAVPHAGEHDAVRGGDAQHVNMGGKAHGFGEGGVALFFFFFFFFFSFRFRFSSTSKHDYLSVGRNVSCVYYV